MNSVNYLMHLMRVVLRIILYLVIITLIAVNIHFYLVKRSDEARVKVAPSASQESLQITAAPSSTQEPPLIEPSVPKAENIIASGPNYPELAKKATESYNKKDFRASSELCKQLSEKDSSYLPCTGISYFKIGDFAAAITYLEKGVDAGKQEYMCRRFLAFAYYYRHEFDKSIMNAEKALVISKDQELEVFYARLMREKQAHRNFASESSSHFKVQFDGYEHGGISRSVIGMLEDAYSQIGRDLDYYPSQPITVILYTNHDFRDVTQAPAWSGGYFDLNDGKIRVPVRGAQGQEALLKTVLFHEYVHALIHSITKNCPRWIHEGMAEYYSKGSSQRIGQKIPFSHLDSAFYQRDSRIIQLAYIQSHSAVSYLIDRYGTGRMKDLLTALSTGNDLTQAFTRAFQMSYTEFADKWGRT
jgi:tetratricopeptide (TPR) repeat protein